MSESANASHERENQPVRPWSSFLIRDFSLLWGASLISATAVEMRQVTSLYQVYELSGSSMKLGITGFLQALPYIVFGLFAGVLADAFDRKRLIIFAQGLTLLPGLALGFLTASGRIEVWHIYLLSLVTSSAQVFGLPARSAIISQLVPSSYLMNAMTLTTFIAQSSFLFAPVFAGILIDAAGVKSTYFIEAALFLPAMAAVSMVHGPAHPGGGGRRVTLKAFVEGMRFIWIERIILALLLLDFAVTLVGYYRPILPIFADEILGVGATGLGTLYAAPAAGAILGSLFIITAGDVRRKGALAVVGAVGFALGLAAFGLSKGFLMAVVAVGVLGFMDAVSVAVRRTVVQLRSPDEMRGRAASFITVFANATNALGALVAGVAVALLGAPRALVLGGALCLAIILGVTRIFPQLWRYRS